jgi:type I restriction-modification system DNA methylase subunit
MPRNISEQRARQVAKDLLKFRNWNTENVSKGGVSLEENEYKNFPELSTIFKGKSKTGTGDGYPDFLLVNSPIGRMPQIVLETKGSNSEGEKAIAEATHYGNACEAAGFNVICVGVAGGEKEICKVLVRRKKNGRWVDLTLNGDPIDWIPSPQQTERILSNKTQTEVQAEKPGNQILAEQANRINEILRECKIKDEYRPIYIATFMLALWQGEVAVQKRVILTQINANAKEALINAGKAMLAESLRVDTHNSILAERGWEIVDILKKLNINSFIREHDYLGQLYETFFRYTGGNTIGQYFTPRHIIEFMADIIDISPRDTILDPACGTGGFLIGALNRMIKKTKKPYEEAINLIKDHLFGIESEPATAALCITNMILRGDGKSGVIKDNCFTNKDYPANNVDFVMMNPPFPHNKKTDTPTTAFLDRALQSIKNRGLLAAIVPYSLLVGITDWHRKTLKSNTLLLTCTMPPDLFQPYASYNTAILVIQKGVPHGSKNTFVARITNDGFKVKKNNRVEREGSQLPQILKAFQKKTEIPEVSAFPVITFSSTEWSPENYIADNKHSDAEFLIGLEESIRNQAAFYIANGNRLFNSSKIDADRIDISSHLFNSSTTINLDGIDFGKVNVADYFKVKLGGKDELEDLEEGPFPVVSTSEFMNGVTSWKKPKIFYEYPTITVATDGSTCSSFVQEYPYYAFYKVAILTPKNKLPVAALYYIAYLLKRQKWRYVYARKFGKERILNTTLIMPVDKNGTPDFKKMAAIIEQTRAYEIIKFYRKTIEKALAGY